MSVTNNCLPIFHNKSAHPTTTDISQLCRAPGQTGQKLISDEHEYECPPDEFGNQRTFLFTSKALHDLHIFIFCIAVFHIMYTTIVMYLSQVRRVAVVGGRVAFFVHAIWRVDYIHLHRCPHSHAFFVSLTATHPDRTLILTSIPTCTFFLSTKIIRGIFPHPQMRVQRWTKWETFGDNKSDSVKNLKLPLPYKNGCHRFWSNFLLQVQMSMPDLNGVVSCVRSMPLSTIPISNLF